MILVVRLLLAAVFAIAGAAKLRDPLGTRRALAGFGVSERLGRGLAVALPVGEGSIAIVLLPAATAPWAALAALGLLATFSVAIAVALRRGREPECNCFGGLRRSRIGWGSLLRNVALIVAAAAVATQGLVGSAPSATGWMAGLSGGELVAILVGAPAVALLAFQGWRWFALSRRSGGLLLGVEDLEAAIEYGAGRVSERGLPIGAVAPDFRASTADGELATLGTVLAPGSPTMLLFADPGCVSCRRLLPDVGRWQREHDGRLRIVVIVAGGFEDAGRLRDQHGLEHVLLQREREIAAAYGAFGTPAAALVYPDRRIVSELALGSEQIEGLVGVVLAASASASANGNQATAVAAGDRYEAITRAALVAAGGGPRAIPDPGPVPASDLPPERISRRTALRAGAAFAALGGSLLGPTLGRATANGATPERAHGPYPVAADGSILVPGGFLCHGKFAICNDARCTRSGRHRPVKCKCKEMHTWNLSPIPCSALRDLTTRTRLISTFTTFNAANLRKVKCKDTPWADCYGAVCKKSLITRKVTCECQLLIENTGTWVTFRPDCNTDVCTKGVYSAASATSVAFGIPVFNAALEQAGQKPPPGPKPC